VGSNLPQKAQNSKIRTQKAKRTPGASYQNQLGHCEEAQRPWQSQNADCFLPAGRQAPAARNDKLGLLFLEPHPEDPRGGGEKKQLFKIAMEASPFQTIDHRISTLV